MSDSEFNIRNCRSDKIYRGNFRRDPSPRKKTCAARLWDLIQPFARFWGLVTAVGVSEDCAVTESCSILKVASYGVRSVIIAQKLPNFPVMSGAGAELLVLRYHAASVVITGAVIVLVLETMWVLALFVDLLCRRGDYTMPLRCWDFTRWTVARIRPPLYACAATALLFSDLTLLATTSGGVLLVLAALRAAVPFSPYASFSAHQTRAGSSLLSQMDSPLPDVSYNAHCDDDYRCEEMQVIEARAQERSLSASPNKSPLLEI